MNSMIENIKHTISEIDIIFDMLCENNTNPAIHKISKIIPILNDIITKLISEIPYYRQLGVDLPQDVILTQLSNLLEAFEHRDIIMLADSLRYEISDTLQVYEEILVQLSVKE